MSWQYDSDGNITWVDDGDSYDYTGGAATDAGTAAPADTTTSPATNSVLADSAANSPGYGVSSAGGGGGAYDAITSAGSSVPTDLVSQLKGLFVNKDGSYNWKAILGSGAAGLTALDYLTNGGLGGISKTNQTPTGYQGGIPKYAASHPLLAGAAPAAAPARRPGSAGQQYFAPVQFQKLAKGGIAGRYLQGHTDGMADKIDTSIDGNQPAKLSHGEFVIPADVVSHLGNGNSDAGAQKLYQMMDKIRMARTGTKKQGKQINPDKFMPGGIAKLAAGGAVAFADGGTTTTTPSATTVNSGVTGTESNLSNWAGPYVTDMLGKAQGLAEMPYQAYQGPLTAGPSALQTQASGTLQNTQVNPNFGKSFTDAGVQQQYMNPYLQGVLQPQLAELRRQAGITQIGNDAKMTQAGAFGGDRQALLTAENNRNLLDQQDKTVGNAYNTAYNTGMQQFNTEQGQASNLINQQANVGNTMQQIEQAGVAADKAQFEEERANPYKMLQFQQSMLQGLPVAAQQYTQAQPSILQQLAAAGAGGIQLADLFKTAP